MGVDGTGPRLGDGVWAGMDRHGTGAGTDGGGAGAGGVVVVGGRAGGNTEGGSGGGEGSMGINVGSQSVGSGRPESHKVESASVRSGVDSGSLDGIGSGVPRRASDATKEGTGGDIA